MADDTRDFCCATWLQQIAPPTSSISLQLVVEMPSTDWPILVYIWLFPSVNIYLLAAWPVTICPASEQITHRPGRQVNSLGCLRCL